MIRTQRSFFAALLGGLSLAVVACQTGANGGSGGGGSGGSGGTSTPVQPLRGGVATPADGGYVVILSNYPVTCSQPQIWTGGCEQAYWNIPLALPTAALTDGAAHSLKELRGDSVEKFP